MVFASQIMSASNKIWKKYGWESREDVDDTILRDELIRRVPDMCNLNEKGFAILEDNNYHSEYRILRECQRIAAGDV